ncbi:MAG: hypothetical protein KJO35_05085, partial [Gammaproteobacteria bacterium]|nr:hypothetical protein [Gammaproteobacteria bacterium]
MRVSAMFWLLLSLSVIPAGAAELSRDFIPAVADVVRLSPDGAYVAASTTGAIAGDAQNLVTMRLSDNHAQALTGYSDIDVRNFFWANDRRLIFSVDRKTDREKSPQYRGSFTILRDGTGGKKLAERRQNPNIAAPQLLHSLPTDWTHVLIQRAGSTALFPEVYTLDVESGRAKLAVARRLGVTRWITDNQGVV